MRGKVILFAFVAERFRITPAYAGKRRLDIVFILCYKDHPRLCGEKGIHAITSLLFIGSPPPMRGKAAETLTDSGWIRITPAYAGKSSRYRLISISSRDHPRLCGEKHYTPFGNICQAGSPPPMRGKACTCGTVHGKSRITPAYAGKRDLNTVTETGS